MRIHMMLLAAAMTAGSAAALAASPFAGTWKTNLASAQLNPRPYVILLEGGNYSCKSCIPPLNVPADGKWHSVRGHDYYDAVMVQIDGPRALTISRRKAGKLTNVGSETVSTDGRTLTAVYHDHSAPNGKVVDSTGIDSRIGPAPKGAHAISGSWREKSVKAVSDAGLVWTLTDRPGGLALSDPTGVSFDARFGGPAVALKGDVGGTMVAIKQVGPRTMQEIDTRASKVVNVSTSTVSPDGKTMTMVNENRRAGGRSRFTATRQKIGNGRQARDRPPHRSVRQCEILLEEYQLNLGDPLMSGRRQSV